MKMPTIRSWLNPAVVNGTTLHSGHWIVEEQPDAVATLIKRYAAR